MGLGFGKNHGSSSSGTAPKRTMKNVKKFVPEYSEIALDQLDKLTGGIGSSGLAAIKGTGSDVADAVNAIVNKVNPFFDETQSLVKKGAASADKAAQTSDYAGEMSRSAVDAAKKGVDAINLSGLSPGEMAAVERANANTQSATGNLGLLNPMNVISNALNFGNAYNDKLGRYNTAVNTLTGATSGATAAANVAQGIPGQFAALGNTANAAGTGKTNAITDMNAIANPAVVALGGTLGMMGQLGQIAAGTKAGSSTSGMQGEAKSECCFIFMEAHHGTLPATVRRFRDRYYRLKPDIATGYRKMARWLVPLMQKSSIIRGLVWNLMVSPATEYSKQPKHGWNKRISHMWLKFWSFYGKL